MNKQDWEMNRDSQDIPMDVWWEMYKEKGGKLKDMNEFMPVMLQVIDGKTRIVNGKMLNLQTALKKLREHYDDKFGVSE